MSHSLSHKDLEAQNNSSFHGFRFSLFFSLQCILRLFFSRTGWTSKVLVRSKDGAKLCCCWCLVLLVTVGRSALRFGTRSGRPDDD